MKLRLVFGGTTRSGLQSNEHVSGDLLWSIPRHIARKRLSFFLRGAGPNPNSDSIKPENYGEFEGVSYVGKCPNTLCSDYAVLNGCNPGGVRDCVFIIRF